MCLPLPAMGDKVGTRTCIRESGCDRSAKHEDYCVCVVMQVDEKINVEHDESFNLESDTVASLTPPYRRKRSGTSLKEITLVLPLQG
jgi:hypothetical protein